MPVPSLVTDLSATIASNSPAGSDNVFPDLDNYLRSLSGFLASIRDNSGNGWVSPYLTAANPSYTGTLTGGTGVVNLGSGQFYKDASGNIGVGVVPSAWTGSGGKNIEFGAAGNAIFGSTSATTYTSNANFDSSWKYSRTGFASRYEQQDSVHRWYTAPSGTAGNAITFTQAMTLDAAGNLGVGAAPTYQLDVVRTGSPVLRVSNGTIEAYIQTEGGASTAKFGSLSNHPLAFATNGTEKARITSGGDLLVGTTASTYSLAGRGVVEINGFNETLVGFKLAGVGSGYINQTTSDFKVVNTQNTPMLFWTNGTERVRIDNAGNLGLGVTPSAWSGGFRALQVSNGTLAGYASGSNVQVEVLSNAYQSSLGTYNYISTATASQYRQISGEHQWKTAVSGTAGNPISFTQAMTLDANGSLLVGATTSAASDTNSILVSPSAKQMAVQHATGTTTGTNYINFLYATGSIGNITQSGTTAVLYNTTSDQRLKTNIVNAPDASALIDSIQVRSFDWISDDSHQRYGMVAQELFEVAPEAVHAPTDPDAMMAVDYSKLVPMLVKEIQSLRARVAALEA